MAVIQGFTEFLPISSSAHLILPSQILGWPDQGLAFDVAVHVGSFVAVGMYFRRDIQQLVRAWFKSLHGPQTPESNLAWYIVVATVPAGITGLIFGGFIEIHLRSMAVIATTTILFGILLGWADLRCRGDKTVYQLSWKTALLVGAAQALALIPGTSRSGITMTCLLYTSDAADDSLRVDLGGRRIIKKNSIRRGVARGGASTSPRRCFFSSRRRHTRFMSVSWARRCV